MNGMLRILNVEDSEDDFLLIERELRRAGIIARFDRVDTPEQFRDALAREPWDLIIADYSMPGFSGVQALEMLTGARLDIPFILVSGTIGEDTAVRAMKAGASDYILKGNLARLAPAIERELREASIRRDRRRAESALKASDENLGRTASLLRATLESTADGILVIGADRRITLHNRKFRDIAGVSEALIDAGEARPVLDDIIARLVNKEAFEDVATHLACRPDSPGAKEHFLPLDFHGGRRVEAFVVPQWLEGRCAGHVVCMRDVTARHDAEQARHRIEAQLFQSQKMEALGSLAGGVAHDFNNLLSVILNYAELLRAKYDGDADATRYVDTMLNAGRRAADLVRQILLFGRRQTQELTPMRLQTGMAEGIELIRAAIPRSVHLDTSFEKDAPVVLADATQMNQVLMNLCINASHAMPSRSGRVAVSVRAESVSAESAASIPDAKPGEYVVLTVADDGSGMDEETLSHIFEPFFTTKAKGEGTGLGLAVVHGIVRAHNGFIRVESRKGSGTTFRVHIPVHHDGMAAREAPPPIEIPRGDGRRILVVDDDRDACNGISEMLESFGYAIASFSDPTAALEAFRRSPKAFDLLFADVNMPGINGVELAKQCLALRSDLPVLLISGISDVRTAEDLRPLGILDVLRKPVPPVRLGLRIHAALSTSRPVVPVASGTPKITFTKASFSAK